MESRETTRVYRDDGGKYRWVYNLNMYKNYSILRTVLKAMFAAVLLFFLIFAGISMASQGNFLEFKGILLITGIILVVGLLMSVLCYFLVAVLYGGRYVALYVMDEKSITQLQPTGQARKSALIGLFAAASGAASGNPAVVIAGMSQGGRLVVTTKYPDIKSLKILPEKGEIRVHSFLTWYTIYVNAEDFEMVTDYIERRAVNARVSR